jgi:hypothetical protein
MATARGTTQVRSHRRQNTNVAIDLENQEATVSIGKIPGEIKEVQITTTSKIKDLFKGAGVANLDGCEIQKNGEEASLDDQVEAGDTILAIARIRGN